MKGDNVHIFNSNHIKSFALIGLQLQGLSNNSWRTIDLQTIDTATYSFTRSKFRLGLWHWTLIVQHPISQCKAFWHRRQLLDFTKTNHKSKATFYESSCFFPSTSRSFFSLFCSSLPFPQNSRLSDFCYQQTNNLSRKKTKKKLHSNHSMTFWIPR